MSSYFQHTAHHGANIHTSNPTPNNHKHQDHNNASFKKTITILLKLPKLIGVCPIKINNKLNKRKKLVLKTNNIQILQTIALLVIYIALSAYELITDEQVDHTKAPNVSIFKEIVNKYLYFGLCCACIVLSYLQHGKLIDFFEVIIKADEELFKLNADIDGSYSYIIKLFAVGLINCFIVFLASLFTDNYFLVMTRVILCFVLFATFGLFIGCLHLIKQRFSFINSQLLLFKSNDLHSEARFRVIAIAHDLLCDAADILNNCFTIQLLVFFTLVFLGTLFAIFSDFRVFFGTENSAVNPLMMVLKNSYLAGFLVFWCITLLATCSSTSDQANETGKIIHTIINRNPESVTIENLKTFSLQLMHRNLAFTACYMFNLDFTLLYTLIGASTTYMVILIQFDLAKPTDTESGCTPSTLNALKNKCIDILNNTNTE